MTPDGQSPAAAISSGMLATNAFERNAGKLSEKSLMTLRRNRSDSLLSSSDGSVATADVHVAVMVTASCPVGERKMKESFSVNRMRLCSPRAARYARHTPNAKWRTLTHSQRALKSRPSTTKMTSPQKQS